MKLLLFHFLLCVFARPTFKPKPASGVLNYAKDSYLKDDVVTLDDKEWITMISCKADSMTFTLTKAEPSLKAKALLTGGPEWNCVKKEPFYRKITKVKTSTANKIEVTTKDVPQKDFFRNAYGYEVCSKVMTNATSILNDITKLKKTVEDNLAKAKTLTAEIIKNGNQSVGKKISKDLSAIDKTVKKSLTEADQRVKEMEKVVKEKKKTTNNKCELEFLNKLLTTVQTNDKLASEALKKAQEEQKGVSNSYSDVVAKVNKIFADLNPIIDSANKIKDQMNPLQKLELSSIVGSKDKILKNANEAQTKKESKKADTAIKDANNLMAKSNKFKETLAKLNAKKEAAKKEAAKKEAAKKEAAKKEAAKKEAAKKEAAKKEAAKKDAKTLQKNTNTQQKNTNTQQKNTNTQQKSTNTQQKNTNTQKKNTKPKQKDRTTVQNSTFVNADIRTKDKVSSVHGAFNKLNNTSKTHIKKQIATSFAFNNLSLTICHKNPSIEKKEEAHLVSYYEKPVKFRKNILVLDKSVEFSHVCCSDKLIVLHYNSAKNINKRLEKIEYITGGKGWGCNNETIQYKVSMNTATEAYFVFNIESKVNSSEFTREFEPIELCMPLLKQIEAEQKKMREAIDTSMDLYKTAKENYDRTNKIGDDATKKAAQLRFANFTEIHDKCKQLATYSSYSCLAEPFASEGAIKVHQTNNKKLDEYLVKLRELADSSVKTTSEIKVSAENVKKLIDEIKKTVESMLVADGFEGDLMFVQADIKEKFDVAYFKIINGLIKLSSKAKKCKNDNEAKKLHSEAEKKVPLMKTLIADTKKAIEQREKEVDAKNQLRKDKKGVKTETKDTLDDIKAIEKKANQKVAQIIGIENKDQNLVKLIEKLEKIHKDAKTKWNELKKYMYNNTDSDSKKKMEDLQLKLTSLLEEAKTTDASIDGIVTQYQAFMDKRSAVMNTISKTIKKKNEIAKKDKELANKLQPQIDEANKAMDATNEAFGKRNLVQANSLLETAKKKADAALQASGSTTVSTTNYSAANTTKGNVKQRVKLFTDESNEVVKKINTNIDLIKKYDKAVGKAIEKELTPLKKKINECNSEAKNWFRTEESSKKALECAQSAQEAIKEFSPTVDEKVKTVTSKFLLALNGKTLSLPSGKVKKITCQGKTVTVDFKEVVFVDTQFTQLEAEKSVACVDENTKTQIAMKRKVIKVTSSTEKKLVVETEFINSQPSSNVSLGASFSKVPVFSNNKITASLSVSDSTHLNKKAIVELIASGAVVASTEKALSKTTLIRMDVDKKVTCISCILSVSVNNVRIASSAEFSINPSITFEKPDTAGRTYYNEETIEVKWKFDPAQSKKNTNTLKLVSNTSKLPVHAKKLKKTEKKDNFKVKDLPKEVKSGDYHFELTINDVTISSVSFSIVRDKSAHQQIVFTSPTAGASFDPGDTIHIKWNVTNSRGPAKLSLGMTVQRSAVANFFIGVDTFIGASIPIEQGSYDFKVPKNLGGDSRYYIYAKYDCKQEFFKGQVCAEDKTDLFAIKSDTCFNFTDITVTNKEEGKYDVFVSVKNIGGCQFTKDDKIKVKMVNANNHKYRDVGFEFSGDKQEESATLPLVKGKAENLVFQIEHKNTKKGEFSWEFSAPFENEFTFDLKQFLADWSCASCKLQKPWKIDKSLVGVDAAKSLGFNDKWWGFCNLVCNNFQTGLQTLKALLKDAKDSSSSESTKKPEPIYKLCSIPAFSPEDKKKCNGTMTDINNGVSALSPTMKIKCKKCIVDGWVKIYNLDNRGSSVKSGTIELKMNFEFAVTANFSIGMNLFKNSNDTTYIDKFEKNVLKEGTSFANAINKGLSLQAVEIPIFGVKAGLGAVSVPGQGSQLKLSAALMFYCKVEVKLTGHITFLFTAKGTIDYVGNIQSVTKKDSKFANKKPDVSLEFLEFQIGVKLTISLGGTANFAIGKIIGADLNLVVVRAVLAAEFKIPPWPAITDRSKFVFGANRACKFDHHFRITGGLDFLDFTFGFTILGYSDKIPVIKKIHVDGFALCFLPVEK